MILENDKAIRYTREHDSARKVGMAENHPKDYHVFSSEQKEILATLVSNTQAIGKLTNECVC